MKQTEILRDKIKRAFRSIGLETSVGNNSEQSRYLTVWTEDLSSFEVRVSNHDNHNLNPDYYLSTTGSGYAQSWCWWQLVILICKEHNLPIPASVKRSQTLHAKKLQAEAEAKAERVALENARIEAEKIKARDYVNNPTIRRWAEKINNASGQKRRHLRSKFNRKYRDVVDPAVLRDLIS